MRFVSRGPLLPIGVALTLMLLTLARPASAQEVDLDNLEEEQGLRTLAVQQRHHHHWHELNISIGLLPIDAFIKGLTVSGSYTLHFNHLFAWEIIRAYGVVTEIETDLQDDLESLEIRPTPFEYVEWAATSSFVFTPFYGKLAVINRALIFCEVFLLGGLGYGGLTNSQNLVIDAGMGARIFFGEYVSLRFDIRWDGFFVNTAEPHHELWIALGISVHLG